MAQAVLQTRAMCSDEARWVTKAAGAFTDAVSVLIPECLGGPSGRAVAIDRAYAAHILADAAPAAAWTSACCESLGGLGKLTMSAWLSCADCCLVNRGVK